MFFWNSNALKSLGLNSIYDGKIALSIELDLFPIDLSKASYGQKTEKAYLYRTQPNKLNVKSNSFSFGYDLHEVPFADDQIWFNNLHQSSIQSS